MKEINYQEKIICREIYFLRFLYRDSHDALGETKVSRITSDPMQNGKKKTGDLWVSTRFLDYNWVLYSWTIPTQLFLEAY